MTSPFRLAALAALGMLFSNASQAQTFTNANDRLPDAYNSGGCIGFADLDGDGFDDLVVLDQSKNLHTLYQTAEGTFVDYDLGQVSGANQWGMCVADFDNDGHKDVFSVVLTTVCLFSDHGSRRQHCHGAGGGACSCKGAIGDTDNDGVLDVFGCHDDALSRKGKAVRMARWCQQ